MAMEALEAGRNLSRPCNDEQICLGVQLGKLLHWKYVLSFGFSKSMPPARVESASYKRLMLTNLSVDVLLELKQPGNL